MKVIIAGRVAVPGKMPPGSEGGYSGLAGGMVVIPPDDSIVAGTTFNVI